jgi:hypothetical protein
MFAIDRPCLKPAHFMAAAGLLLLAGTALSVPARADDYTDLLDILRAKGSLTRGEYDTLLAKHRHRGAPARQHGQSAAAAAEPQADATPRDAAAQAQLAASRAAASAALAQAAATSTELALKDPSVVHTDIYVPGKGITLHAGAVDINLSGFINGYYTFNAPGSGTPVAGGLSSGGSGFDSSSVRGGLLPAAVLLKLSTVQSGIDMSANFGVYPGINSSNAGAFGANSGGSAVGLGTPGVDFRQIYVTAGTKDFGTVTAGRAIGLFGSDAILSDATLLSVGSPGGNAAPANTALGRIGVGYIYTDFLPQLSYTSPTIGGVTGTVGVMTPLDEVNFAGGGLSATNTQHNTPMVQGKLTYDFDTAVKGRLWASFLLQPEDHLTGSGIAATANRNVTVVAGDAGAKGSYGPFDGVLYYYRGSGIGTTGLFFDGIAANGEKRDSEGYYAQAGFKLTPKFKLVGSYGASALNLAPGEVAPTLVRRNESEIGSAYYTLNEWMTLIAEFAHTTSKSHGPDTASDNTVSVGTMIFF